MSRVFANNIAILFELTENIGALRLAPNTPYINLGSHLGLLLPSRQKNIDNTSTLLLAQSLFLNRRGAESAEGIKKKLIYSL
jgi:hypothetical protein